MTIDPEPEQSRPMHLAFVPGTYLVVITVPIVLLFFAWNQLNQMSLAAAANLF